MQQHSGSAVVGTMHFFPFAKVPPKHYYINTYQPCKCKTKTRYDISSKLIVFKSAQRDIVPRSGILSASVIPLSKKAKGSSLFMAGQDILKIMMSCIMI